jgi:NADPH:quinone reductase-like Zn-dependent oxidoreductase
MMDSDGTSGGTTMGDSSPRSESAAMAGAMQAAVYDRYGTPDVLGTEQVRRPAPGAGEVLLRVGAAGLDRGAWHLLVGRPYLLRLVFGLRTPKVRTLGREVAGTIVAVGTGVTGFEVGDEAFGIGTATFAEYAVARVDLLARKPVDVTFAQAATVAISGSTALQALRDAGRVQAGQKVLITGASGGAGTYAVRLAKVFGAEVTGVCSTAKVDLVRGLGADHVIDYTREDFADGEKRYDLIIDLAGNPPIAKLRRALTPQGTAVIAGGEGGGNVTGGIGRQFRGQLLSGFTKQRMTGLLCKENAADLDVLRSLMESGQLVPVVDRTCSLSQLPDAFRSMEAGMIRGKIAVVPVSA